MATTPKAVRKNVKAKTAARNTASTYENAAEKLKPGSPKKAKEAVRTLAKKDDKAYLRVQKTRTAARKVKLGK